VSQSGLRIVTFNVLPPAYQLVAGWAQQMGNKIVLVVTTPGPSTRRTPSYRGVVEGAPPDQDVLVTTRLRRVAAPLIRELKPDLVISMTFPYRIPPEITSIPAYGAVNLHPAPLPYYRGPNPIRLIYDGFPTIGATLHRTEEDFDTGVIYSLKTAPLPAPTTAEAILAIWPSLMMQALAEGIALAVAGSPGVPQDHSRATYAAQFTEEEHWLDWSEPGAVLQRKVAALNLFGMPTAKAMLDGQPHLIQRFEPLGASSDNSGPGAILERAADSVIVRVGDGAARVFASPAPQKETA
jgi:methionyl-tRNA formyltransferase